MIIGLTGTNGAGKTAVAQYLESLGFECHSLSDEIRRELTEQGLPSTRENLIHKGNAIRANEGRSALADRVKARLADGTRYVIDSIRNPSEVESLRATGRFRLLLVDAPQQVRYRRVVARGGDRLPASFEEFVDQERREWESDDPAAQRMKATIEMADETISNEAGVAELRLKVNALVESAPQKPETSECK